MYICMYIQDIYIHKNVHMHTYTYSRTHSLHSLTLCLSLRSASANGSNPGEALPPLAPIVTVRSGCWVRCRDGYLLAWDLSPSI